MAAKLTLVKALRGQKNTQELLMFLEETLESKKFPDWTPKASSVLQQWVEKVTQEGNMLCGNSLTRLLHAYVSFLEPSAASSLASVFLQLNNVVDLTAKWEEGDDVLNVAFWEGVNTLFTALYNLEPSFLGKRLLNVGLVFLATSVDPQISLFLRQIRLKSLNCLLEKSRDELRAVLRSAAPDCVSQLASSVGDVGDFDLQTSLVEAVCRLTSASERGHCVADWFPESSSNIHRLFVRIRDFDPDCRRFLNAFNSGLGPRQKVFTLSCSSATIGRFLLQKPNIDGYEHLWIDFNLGTLTLSLLFDRARSDGFPLHQQDRLWETIVIYGHEVEVAHLAATPNGHTLTLTLGRDPLDFFASPPSETTSDLLSNKFVVDFHQTTLQLESLCGALYKDKLQVTSFVKTEAAPPIPSISEEIIEDPHTLCQLEEVAVTTSNPRTEGSRLSDGASCNASTSSFSQDFITVDRTKDLPNPVEVHSSEPSTSILIENNPYQGIKVQLCSSPPGSRDAKLVFPVCSSPAELSTPPPPSLKTPSTRSTSSSRFLSNKNVDLGNPTLFPFEKRDFKSSSRLSQLTSSAKKVKKKVRPRDPPHRLGQFGTQTENGDGMTVIVHSPEDTNISVDDESDQEIIPPTATPQDSASPPFPFILQHGASTSKAIDGIIQETPEDSNEVQTSALLYSKLLIENVQKSLEDNSFPANGEAKQKVKLDSVEQKDLSRHDGPSMDHVYVGIAPRNDESDPILETIEKYIQTIDSIYALEDQSHKTEASPRNLPEDPKTFCTVTPACSIIDQVNQPSVTASKVICTSFTTKQEIAATTMIGEASTMLSETCPKTFDTQHEISAETKNSGFVEKNLVSKLPVVIEENALKMTTEFQRIEIDLVTDTSSKGEETNICQDFIKNEEVLVISNEDSETETATTIALSPVCMTKKGVVNCGKATSREQTLPTKENCVHPHPTTKESSIPIISNVKCPVKLTVVKKYKLENSRRNSDSVESIAIANSSANLSLEHSINNSVASLKEQTKSLLSGNESSHSHSVSPDGTTKQLASCTPTVSQLSACLQAISPNKTLVSTLKILADYPVQPVGLQTPTRPAEERRPTSKKNAGSKKKRKGSLKGCLPDHYLLETPSRVSKTNEQRLNSKKRLFDAELTPMLKTSPPDPQDHIRVTRIDALPIPLECKSGKNSTLDGSSLYEPESSNTSQTASQNSKRLKFFKSRQNQNSQAFSKIASDTEEIKTPPKRNASRHGKGLVSMPSPRHSRSVFSDFETSESSRTPDWFPRARKKRNCVAVAVRTYGGKTRKRGHVDDISDSEELPSSPERRENNTSSSKGSTSRDEQGRLFQSPKMKRAKNIPQKSRRKIVTRSYSKKMKGREQINKAVSSKALSANVTTTKNQRLPKKRSFVQSINTPISSPEVLRNTSLTQASSYDDASLIDNLQIMSTSPKTSKATSSHDRTRRRDYPVEQDSEDPRCRRESLLELNEVRKVSKETFLAMKTRSASLSPVQEPRTDTSIQPMHPSLAKENGNHILGSKKAPVSNRFGYVTAIDNLSGNYPIGRIKRRFQGPEDDNVDSPTFGEGLASRLSFESDGAKADDVSSEELPFRLGDMIPRYPTTTDCYSSSDWGENNYEIGPNRRPRANVALSRRHHKETDTLTKHSPLSPLLPSSIDIPPSHSQESLSNPIPSFLCKESLPGCRSKTASDRETEVYMQELVSSITKHVSRVWTPLTSRNLDILCTPSKMAPKTLLAGIPEREEIPDDDHRLALPASTLKLFMKESDALGKELLSISRRCFVLSGIARSILKPSANK